jgi:hypothetical protein
MRLENRMSAPLYGLNVMSGVVAPFRTLEGSDMKRVTQFDVYTLGLKPAEFAGRLCSEPHCTIRCGIDVVRPSPREHKKGAHFHFG